MMFYTPNLYTTWEVASATDPYSRYVVSYGKSLYSKPIQEHNYSCTCLHWQKKLRYGDDNGYCKHIRTVMNDLVESAMDVYYWSGRFPVWIVPIEHWTYLYVLFNHARWNHDNTYLISTMFRVMSSVECLPYAPVLNRKGQPILVERKKQDFPPPPVPMIAR